jgi:hypothetical protein
MNSCVFDICAGPIYQLSLGFFHIDGLIYVPLMTSDNAFSWKYGFDSLTANIKRCKVISKSMAGKRDPYKCIAVDQYVSFVTWRQTIMYVFKWPDIIDGMRQVLYI